MTINTTIVNFMCILYNYYCLLLFIYFLIALPSTSIWRPPCDLGCFFFLPTCIIISNCIWVNLYNCLCNYDGISFTCIIHKYFHCYHYEHSFELDWKEGIAQKLNGEFFPDMFNWGVLCVYKECQKCAILINHMHIII